MTFSSRILLRRLALGASLTLVACGSSTVTGGDDQGDTGASSDVSSDGSTLDGSGGDGVTIDGATDGVTDESGDAIASDVADGGDAPPVCSDEPTKARCQACCGLEHPAGEKTFAAAVLACACADGICKSDCATTACASPSTAPNDVCRTCLNDSIRTAKPDAGADAAVDGKCTDSVKAACSSDAKCVAYATCLGTCK